MGTGCAKLKQNQKQHPYSKNTFKLEKIVGKGGFGKVWKVTDKKNNNIYALKIIDKAKVITKKSVNSVMNQRNLLIKLNHPFIVNMIRGFQDRDNLYLVLDFLNGGDLRYYINHRYQFSEDQIRFIALCILQGLEYLHSQNIIHRDIKPQNLIFDNYGYLRITDLGVAREMKLNNAHETSGTPGYMAPQVMLRQNHSFPVDYFALGVILYQLVMGKRPFNGKARKQIRDDMLARQAKISNPPNKFSLQCIDFTNRLIQRVSKKRLGYNGIHQILSHPWLNMEATQKINFYNRKKKSPITLLSITLHKSIQQDTEPDDIYRQNRILLKKQQVQQLFLNYEYCPEETRHTNSNTLNNTNKSDFEKTNLKTKDTQKSRYSTLNSSVSKNVFLKQVQSPGLRSQYPMMTKYTSNNSTLNANYLSIKQGSFNSNLNNGFQMSGRQIYKDPSTERQSFQDNIKPFSNLKQFSNSSNINSNIKIIRDDEIQFQIK